MCERSAACPFFREVPYIQRGSATHILPTFDTDALLADTLKCAKVLLSALDTHHRLPPSSSAGALTPTGGGLAVVRLALRRRRRGLCEARFPPGVGDSRGPLRPRRRGAPALAGGGGGGNVKLLPPARHWGEAAPLQKVRSSAAAHPDQARSQFTGVLSAGRGAAPSSFTAVGGRCWRASPGAFPSSAADDIGLDEWAVVRPSALSYRDLGGGTVFGGVPGLLFRASVRCGRPPSCGADATVSY